jgi:hypothetical protein
VSATSISETTGDTEEIDALPALIDGPTAVPVGSSPGAGVPAHRGAVVALPTVQAAAVAAGGFVAGAAFVGLVARRRAPAARATARSARRRIGKRGRNASAAGRAGELLQIVGSRSLLVDVHLLGAPADR